MIFLQKSLEKPTGLRLKGVSSSNFQVSTPFYSTKVESSSHHGNVAIDDEEDFVSVTPSDSDFPPIENPPVYQNQLRVLTILNDDFEIGILCTMSLCFQKTNLKENISK